MTDAPSEDRREPAAVRDTPSAEPVTATAPAEPVTTTVPGEAERDVIVEREVVPVATEDRTATLPATDPAPVTERSGAHPAPPPPPAVSDPVADAAATRAEPTVPTPAAVDSPPPRHGNRLVATLWMLFAALLFEAGYIVLIAGIVALVDGPSEVGVELPQFFRTPYITWIPVVIFAVLYELSVLILGRAGRFAYIVASLIVGLLVWILSAQLILFLQARQLAPGAELARTLELPTFVLLGVLAREVMLWTGYAVGARGRRMRRLDRRAREEYKARQEA